MILHRSSSTPRKPWPHALRWAAHLGAGLATGLLVPTLASAQTFADPALQALYAAENHEELQRLAVRRVAVRADDAQAVLALALAALTRDDAPARGVAIERAQACLALQPKAAPCHYALGVVLGIQAMAEGLFKAARSVGTVRESLSAAHELDLSWYPARSALMEFYLHAPGLLGGSHAKAGELAAGAAQPDVVRALQARILMADKQYEPALQALTALPAPLEPALAQDVRAWATQCALAMVNNAESTRALPALQRLQRQHPGHAGPVYALARARGEQGAHDEALKLYEQAAALKGAEDWPIAYRMGMAQQALGRPDAARLSLRRFVDAGKGQKASLDDARKRLEQLGG